MTSDSSADIARRTHPSSVLFRLGTFLRQLAIPLILVFVFSSGERMELYASLLALPLGIYEIWRYWTMTYRITDDQLIVREGVIYRSERHIPLVRVQNIDLVQNFFHRLLSVAEVRIETASGSEPEAVLKVLALDEVERMRQQIFARRKRVVERELSQAGEVAEAAELSSPAPADEPVELLHLSLGELVKLGVITFRGLAVVGVAFGVAWQLRVFDRLEDQWDQLNAFMPQVEGVAFVLSVTGLAIAAFLAITILSVLWAVVTLYDYRLVRVGEDLRVTCGLWTKLTATIPRERIQLVSLRQSLLHRLFRRISISIETAGGSGEADKVPVNRRWLVPLVSQDRLENMLHEIQPAMQLLHLDWQPLSRLARRRLVRKALVLSLVLSVPFIFISPVAAVIAFPIIVAILVWHAYAQARGMRYARSESGVAFRSGVFVRRSSATRIDRIQNIAQTQSPFDRRYAMATVAVDTAGAGPAGHKIEIPYLDWDIASSLRMALLAETARTDFSWT